MSSQRRRSTRGALANAEMAKDATSTGDRTKHLDLTREAAKHRRNKPSNVDTRISSSGARENTTQPPRRLDSSTDTGSGRDARAQNRDARARASTASQLAEKDESGNDDDVEDEEVKKSQKPSKFNIPIVPRSEPAKRGRRAGRRAGLDDDGHNQNEDDDGSNGDTNPSDNEGIHSHQSTLSPHTRCTA